MAETGHRARGQPGVGLSPDEGAGPTGVLRRLVAGAAPNPRAALPQPAAPTAERGAAVAIARAANRAHGLHLAADQVQIDGITLAELPELLPEGALIAVVEGAGERLGIVALCPAIITSLIEMQALGRISARPVTLRRATRTDAAIAAAFVNLLLEELATGLGSRPLGEAVAGLRYASYLDDPRPLGLMLEDAGFHGLALDLRIGARGERRGTVLIAVPGRPAAGLPPPQMQPVLPAPVGMVAPPDTEYRGTQAREAEAARPPGPTMADAVRHAPLPLVAVLCRRTISLRELRALQPGTVLSLPKGALSEVTVETVAAQIVLHGQLGEADGSYAVRLGAGPASAPGMPGSLSSTGADLPMGDSGSPDDFRPEPDAQPLPMTLATLPNVG